MFTKWNAFIIRIIRKSKFLQVYVLTNGDCLYQGATSKLLPYLESMKLPCPMYHNPADYSTYNYFLANYSRISFVWSANIDICKYCSNWACLWRVRLWENQYVDNGIAKWTKFTVVRQSKSLEGCEKFKRYLEKKI